MWVEVGHARVVTTLPSRPLSSRPLPSRPLPSRAAIAAAPHTHPHRHTHTQAQTPRTAQPLPTHPTPHTPPHTPHPTPTPHTHPHPHTPEATRCRRSRPLAILSRLRRLLYEEMEAGVLVSHMHCPGSTSKSTSGGQLRTVTRLPYMGTFLIWAPSLYGHLPYMVPQGNLPVGGQLRTVTHLNTAPLHRTSSSIAPLHRTSSSKSDGSG